MSAQERIRLCRIINQMENKKAFCKRLGLENQSTFHGNPVRNYDKKKER